MGFNDPLYVQYLRFVQHTAVLDFGESFLTHRPAIEMVFDRLPATVELAGGALVLIILVAIPLGVFAAMGHGKSYGHFLTLIVVIGQAMPSFWLGILLIMVFSVDLRLLPSFGRGDLSHLILPSVTLAAWFMAKTTRVVRAEMLEVLRQDYIRAAHAKGIPYHLVVSKHAFRNVLITLTTVLGLDVGQLLGGAITTEIVFAWSGMGRQVVTAALARDYNVVQASVFVIAIIVVAVNLGTDILYHYLDPRIRAQ
jgi:peptide/nickel transport system permease protein